MVRWTLTELALDEVEIHRRLEGSRDRQFRALSFPAGIETIEEMEKAWAKIDFGGKQSAQEMVAVIKELEPQLKYVSYSFWTRLIKKIIDRDAPSVSTENGMPSEQEAPIQDGNDSAASSPGQAAHGDDPSQSQSPSPRPPSTFPSFREPDKNIIQLRQLALQGREETLKEEAEDREKVVWGSVDGWRDGQVRREACGVLGCGTLPGADDRLESLQVGGVVVGAPVMGQRTPE